MMKEPIQTGLRLPADLVERLKLSGIGVSAEVRRRLEMSFIWEGLASPSRWIPEPQSSPSPRFDGARRVPWFDFAE